MKTLLFFVALFTMAFLSFWILILIFKFIDYYLNKNK